jgi:hypothetical protein
LKEELEALLTPESCVGSMAGYPGKNNQDEMKVFVNFQYFYSFGSS